MKRDEVFNDMYRRFYTRMIKFFVRLRWSPEDANDLAQETFLRFFRALDEYRGDAKWAFLEEIARNVSLNRIRAQQTHKRQAQLVSIDDVSGPGEPGGGPDVVEILATKQHRERLYAEVAALPPRQRRCLRLRMQEYKYEDIARVEQTTVDAVKSAIRDATKTLRAKLGDIDALPEVDR